jgi:hypothetical protein
LDSERVLDSERELSQEKKMPGGWKIKRQPLVLLERWIEENTYKSLIRILVEGL